MFAAADEVAMAVEDDSVEVTAIVVVVVSVVVAEAVAACACVIWLSSLLYPRPALSSRGVSIKGEQ
jgi:hypothetical protein